MSQPVLFFDSGVGGLSVLEQVRQRCPQLNLSYLMDDAAFPYGIQPDAVLSQRILKICTRAVQQYTPQLLVIACNTASTLALPILRKNLNIPVVGVVPAIKPAAQLARGGHIGLLATPATVERLYINDLIQDFAEDCQVERFGSSQLVHWAEQYLNGELATPELEQQLQRHLQPWLNHCPHMNHVVLGCTHFPLLKSSLQSLWREIHWVDSGEAIARRVASLLPQTTTTNNRTSGDLRLHWTSHKSAADGAVSFLQRLGSLQQCSALPSASDA